MSFSPVRIARRIAVVVAMAAGLLGTSLVSRAAASTDATELGAAPAPRTVASHVTTRGSAEARGVYSSDPVTLRNEQGESLMAFPPSKTASARPMSVIYLHGAHARVANGCPWFRSGASELGWLVCPEGPEAQPDGSWSWSADLVAQRTVVDRALRAAAAKGASTEPGVAVGFSQGSYVAIDLIKTHQARFRGLVLLGADLHPNAQTLRDAGVVRVAFGAGALDGAHDALALETQRLAGEGIETRFYDLGRVGHTYAATDPTVLRDAIAWAGGL